MVETQRLKHIQAGIHLHMLLQAQSKRIILVEISRKRQR